MRVSAFGDSALRLDLPEGTDRTALHRRLLSWPGVSDFLVGDRHLLVTFDGEPPSLDGIFEAHGEGAPTSRRHHVRVRYDGPDLDEVCASLGLTREAFVSHHSGRDYDVQLIGFLPGFAYLGPLDEMLSKVPRRAAPRPRVPALSVAIAAGRTAIYPFASPGGWQLIGSAVDFTPFSPDTGALLQFGDTVRFVPE